MSPSRRILHLGNILNNGYLNAKFQRRRGWAADSVTVDYRHVQAQPEWEEVAIINPDLAQFDPDWSTIDLGGYQRVSWFHDVPQAGIKQLAQEIAARDAASGDGPSANGHAARAPKPAIDVRGMARTTLDRTG